MDTLHTSPNPIRDPLKGAGEGLAPLPWRDGRLLALLAIVLALQLASLARSEGYQIADSVEYMDRAHAVARGAGLDPGTIRSFAYSALLTPVFLAAEAVGVENWRVVVLIVRLLQMACGLMAVAVTARIGSRLTGTAGGWMAGLVLGANPIFLRWSITPLAATACSLCVVLALDGLLRPGGFRRGLGTGAWLGLAILLAFKSIPIAGALLLAALVRDRLRHRVWFAGTLCGLGAGLLLQSLIDLWAYGRFGSSLQSYLQANLVGTTVSLCGVLGLYDLGAWIYRTLGTAESIDTERFASMEIHSLTPPSWYLTELTRRCLAWPLAALAGLGLLAHLLPPRRPAFLIAAGVAANVLILSMKGSKSFRLWLPFLPFAALLIGCGFELLRGGQAGRVVRRAFATTVVLTGVFLGLGILARQNQRPYAGYWRAMEVVNDASRAGEGDAEQRSETRPRVASAYHWAVLYRQSPGVELIKLPHHLDRWSGLKPAQRERCLAAVESLDWLLAHLQILSQNPALMAHVNRLFEVEELIYERSSFGGLAPICVLRRRSGDPSARTFFELIEGADPETHARSLQHPLGIEFAGPAAEGEGGGTHRLRLLGFEVETGLAGGELAWLTYHWEAGTLGDSDYAFLDNLTDSDGNLVHSGHLPGLGALPTSSWPPGAIVRESLPLILPTDPLRFGRAQNRGDLIGALLWMRICRLDAAGAPIDCMEPMAPGPTGSGPGTAGAPLRPPADPADPSSRGDFRYASDGRFWNAGGSLLIGGFWIPVPPAARIDADQLPGL